MSLNNVYKTPEHPGSFTTLETLYRATKGQFSKSYIRKWLQSKDSYTLHKPVIKRFRKNRVIVGKINQQFQADLVDMQSLSKYNDGYRYLLTCIDVLSKYAWAIPLSDKKAETVVSGFEKIFSERVPCKLQTDAGGEFKNHILKKYLNKKNIGYFTTDNDTKASIVERFNRTLKTRMWKYFTEMNTYRYLDVITKLVASYNHTWHRSIQMEPAAVSKENQSIVLKNLYGSKILPKSRPKLKVGDTVRISKEKLHFQKGYEQNWTQEIFTISQIVRRNPIVYKLKDLAGEEIRGTFYEQELQKITDTGYYPIERVIKQRKRNGKTQFFVKFKGYPEKFNMWVEEIESL